MKRYINNTWAAKAGIGSLFLLFGCCLTQSNLQAQGGCFLDDLPTEKSEAKELGNSELGEVHEQQTDVTQMINGNQNTASFVCGSQWNVRRLVQDTIRACGGSYFLTDEDTVVQTEAFHDRIIAVDNHISSASQPIVATHESQIGITLDTILWKEGLPPYGRSFIFDEEDPLHWYVALNANDEPPLKLGCGDLFNVPMMVVTKMAGKDRYVYTRLDSPIEIPWVEGLPDPGKPLKYLHRQTMTPMSVVTVKFNEHRTTPVMENLSTVQGPTEILFETVLPDYPHKTIVTDSGIWHWHVSNLLSFQPSVPALENAKIWVEVEVPDTVQESHVQTNTPNRELKDMQLTPCIGSLIINPDESVSVAVEAFQIEEHPQEFTCIFPLPEEEPEEPVQKEEDALGPNIIGPAAANEPKFDETKVEILKALMQADIR